MQYFEKQKADLIEYIDNKIDNSNKITDDLYIQLQAAKDDQTKKEIQLKMRLVNRFCNSYHNVKDKLLEAFETEKELTEIMKAELI